MDIVQVEETAEKPPVRRVIFEMILTVALSAGCWYTYFSMFPSPAGNAVSVALIVILPALLYLLCRMKYMGRFLVFYVFIIVAVFFVMFYQSVWNGFLVMANIVVEVLNGQFDAGLITFETSGDVAEWGRDSLMALSSVMLLSSSAIAYSVYYREAVTGFIITALPVVTGLCLGAEPSVWLLALLVSCWIGLLVLSAVERPPDRKRRGMLYIQNGRRSSMPYIFLIVCISALLAYILAFSGDDYKPPDSVDEARDIVVAAEEHIRYDRLGGDDTDGLSCGDLTKVHPLEYTENTVLELRMQMPQPMYLRKFTGGSFEDGKWKEAQDGAFSGEYTGMMEWLESRGFYPWMQQERLYRMSENYDFVSVDVSNVNGSSKYLYLPYEAVLTGDVSPENADYRKDYGAYAKGLTGERKYTFKAFLARMQDYDEGALSSWLSEVKKNSKWESYAEPEAVYRRYVYDTYLDISPDEYELLNSAGADKCLGKSIDYTLSYIRGIFDEEYEYDTETKAAGKGRDELEYFINSSHRGNDMHFATAAALIFRYAGIPARYAEGYYLSPDAMKLYTEMSDISYNVLDSDAHCWVEVYVDEIGWFPVEVIPGYYDMATQQVDDTEEDEKIEEETNRNYETEVPEDSEPEKHDESNPKKVDPLWLILAALILLILIYELAGRRHIKRLLASFRTVMTDRTVFRMYRYSCRLMAFDGYRPSDDPYDRLDEISECYDGVSEMTYAEFLRLVNRVRFGGMSLDEEEHKKTAAYVTGIGRHVYAQQNAVKKFIMKFVIFYV